MHAEDEAVGSIPTYRWPILRNARSDAAQGKRLTIESTFPPESRPKRNVVPLAGR
jgi:hypothetical protein